MDFEKEFAELNDELKARVKACKTSKDLVAIAEEEGIELSEEQLDVLSGGGDIDWNYRSKEAEDECLGDFMD